jgi:hypothetical protein
MNLRRLLLVAAIAAAGTIGAGRAQAQYGGCGYGGYGYWDIGRLYSVLSQNVPHFAAFPPVYYSVPVARTYGYSPFAYPPGVMTPEVMTVEPLSIINPFIDASTTGTADATEAPMDRTTAAPVKAAPLAIINPFVASPAAEAVVARR